ncbi:MAG: TlpA family protein disulfide reductase [Saprospiraceae bacterium]|nr:TlpA family protein disulfide reductase [Saprospiraceae bacterium]
MKKSLLFFFLLPAMMWAQGNKPAAAKKPSGNVTLICRVYGVPTNLDSLYVYENMGLANKIVARGGRRPVDSAYVLTVPMSAPKMYLVGSSEQSMAKVILGEEKEVTLWGNSQFMNKARTVNSAANKNFEAVQTRVNQLQEQSTLSRTQFNMATGAARTKAQENLAALGKAKEKYLDSLKKVNQMLWRYASLKLSPDHEGQAGIGEAEFYGMNYFKYADLKDKGFDDMPEVFSAFEAYTATLINMGTPHATAIAMAENKLKELPAGSPTYRRALGGIISTLKTTNSPEYVTLTKKYIDQFRNDNLGEIPRLEMDVRRAGTYVTGIEAPELAGMTPDSSNFSLTQLRGKVVMIDFWASWCGPCRKENPNVVANYHKYKDKGFDILGVSLDRDMGAWRKAIAADGLPWHHISDLKGWQSAHAALYSVTSIPQTLLLDRDGKIIARNLRGEALGQKLKELFGS